MYCKNLVEMYQYMTMFSERQANIIPRSIIVSTLYTGDSHKALGKYTYPELIKTNILEYGVNENIISNIHCEEFINNVLVRAIYDILRVCTSNRARKRRKIVHLLTTWREIQPNANYIDHQIFIEKKNGK